MTTAAAPAPAAASGPTRILPHLYLGCQRDVLNEVPALALALGVDDVAGRLTRVDPVGGRKRCDATPSPTS